LALLAERNCSPASCTIRLRNSLGNFSLPDDEHARTLRQAYMSRRRPIMCTSSATPAKFLRELAARGLQVIGLKGIYLLDNVYENIGLRFVSDVDLLVREGDLDAVIACLKDLGYDNKTWFDPQADNQDLMHVPPLKNEAGLMIELHWTDSFDRRSV
jgi:hypothetical protein